LVHRLKYTSPIRKRILQELKQTPETLKKLLENSSEQTQKYIKKILDEKPLLLPEPKKGSPVSQVRSGKQIELPAKSPTSLEMQEIKQFGGKSQSSKIPAQPWVIRRDEKGKLLPRKGLLRKPNDD
jgi:hypothetical protein